MLKFIRFPYILACLAIPFVISSCNTFDPPLVVPAYGHIDSIHFNVPIDSARRQGSASANVQYAWVYLDDNPVGTFQMPCTFPMIASNGVHNIKVYPGVIPAGQTSPAAIYPFYQFYSTNVTLQQGSTVKLKPTSAYYIWSEFPYKEDFETETVGDQPRNGFKNYYGNGNPLAKTTTAMIVTNDPKLVFDGHGNSGMVVVNSTYPYYSGMTWMPDSLPNSSTPVYLELNYRATASFSIQLFESDPTLEQDTAHLSSPIVIVEPSTGWRKLYVSLNSTIQEFTFYPYNISFTMQWPQGDVSDTLLLDNIKILD